MEEYGDSRGGSSYDRSTAMAYIPSRTSTQSTQELLYVTLSVVLGSSLLTLIAVMFVCAWRQRQRRHVLGSYFLLLFACITDVLMLYRFFSYPVISFIFLAAIV